MDKLAYQINSQQEVRMNVKFIEEQHNFLYITGYGDVNMSCFCHDCLLYTA